MSALVLHTLNIKNPNPLPGGGYPQPAVDIVVFKNDARSLDEWISKHTTALSFDDPGVSMKDSPYIFREISNKKEAILGGQRAITFESRAFETSPNPTITLSNGNIVAVILERENDQKDPQLRDFYPIMLSTFTFQ